MQHIERWYAKAMKRGRTFMALGKALAIAVFLLIGWTVLPFRGPYTHLAYLSIVLASYWWGVRGAVIAVLLVLIPPFGALPHAEFSGTLAQGAAYILVGVVVGVLRDRMKRAEAAWHMAEANHKQLVDKSLAGIFIYRDERIIYANSRFKEIVGYAPEEIIGQTFWRFIHEKDQARIREYVAKRASDATQDLRYECRLVSQEGRVVWVEVVSSPADFEGRPAVLVSIYNITDRKETEEQRRELSKLAHKQEEQLVHSTRLAEMGEMAAGVAHELNQPLTGIKNFARNACYMLEEGEGDLEEVKQNLRLISSQVDRASKIINQMRELARRTERRLAPVDVNSALRESVEFVMPQLKLSAVEVTVILAPELPMVLGDRIRLEQVFLNLLTNARHAMEEAQERRLRVATRHDPDAAWPVVIEIADTGHGFSPEVAEKLFTPFFSTKKASHGTGLGLSISLSIIKDHQGTIDATGEEGKGAVFTVRLPVWSE